jgi:hypothetical protein
MSPQLNSYRNAVLRKRDELVKLNNELAREQEKISPLQRRILSAQSTIQRTKSESTIKSKLREIERANKLIADIQSKCGTVYRKIAQKEKELATAETNFRNEEAKVSRRRAEEEKKRQQQLLRQTGEIQGTMRRYEHEQAQMKRDIGRLQALPQKITVLFMASNPANTVALKLDEEARAIQQQIRLSEYRDSIQFETRWAVRTSDILQAINETNPTIVHFSGHGTQSGELLFLSAGGTERIVTKEAITAAMATSSDTIRLVVFNACFTESQATSVVKHVDAAIGMTDSIGDDAARIFAAQLYASIGFGRTLQTAFDQAIAQLQLEGFLDDSVPRIYSRNGIDLDKMILVRPEEADLGD